MDSEDKSRVEEITVGWRGGNPMRGVRAPELAGTLVEEDNARKKGLPSEAGNSKRKRDRFMSHTHGGRRRDWRNEEPSDQGN